MLSYMYIIVYVYVYLKMCRLLDWRERRTTTATENISKFDKVVIISHAFHPKEFEVRLMYL